MKRIAVAVLVVVLGISISLLAVSCGGGSDKQGSGAPVKYAQIQSLFTRNGCTGCHPGLNPSLNLQAGKSYDALVGIRALEDPDLYRVVAGDPDRSFLYLKVGGNPVIADIPAVGSRMPPEAPPIAAEDIQLIHDWIAQGAKGPDGVTGGPLVTTPGTPPASIEGSVGATQPNGTGTVTGKVIDQERRPIAGAFVTLLLQGSKYEGGEEHYRVAQTDAKGRFTLTDAPTGRFLMKTYAPNSIYVTRIVALAEGGTETVNVGLPNRVVPNPTISKPAVAGRKLSLTVNGSNIDGNYVLALNPGAGVSVELHRAGNQPGRWTAVAPTALPGPWVFMAVDKQCNISEFLTVAG